MIIDGLHEAMNYLQHFHTDITDLESTVFIINHLIQRNSIPLKGSPSEGLQIMGLLETRALDFKNVIMLSVNEGTLPAGRSSNSLILHEVKRYFGLPTYQEKDTVYGYHFFRLLQRAEQIHILYNTDSDTSLAEKSRFLKQLDFEINAQHLDNIRLHELVLPTMVSSEQQSKEFSIAKTQAIVKQLLEMEYNYTQLNEYLNCPLQFYLKHIANIKPADDISESVEQKLIGNAIHDLLDKIGKRLVDKPTDYPQIIGEELNKLDISVEEAMRNAIFKEHQNQDKSKIYIDLSRGKSYLATEVVKRAATSYLNKLKEDFEKAEKEQYSFKILATEKRMITTVKVGEQPIKLKGFADRIDLREGIVTLLDYKTGYVSDEGLKCEDLSDIFNSTDHKQLLQLLMYAYLFDRGQETGDRIQDTGYSDQGTANEIQNPKSKIQNPSAPKTVNCQLSTVNYSCGIISFQRLYKKEQHELYPTFQLSEDSNQVTVDSGQGTDNGIQNSKSKIQNSDNLSPEDCQPSTVNCQLSTVNSKSLITPKILQLFESHLINLLSDIINPELPFAQTDDEDHCRYCDYATICKKSTTQDE